MTNNVDQTANDIRKGYLRNRPFMIIQRSYKPEKGQVTSKKNFGQDGKWEVFEMASFHTKVSNKQLTEAEVVIDLLTHDVIKNRFPQDSSEVAKHYTEKYKDKVSQAVAVWMSQRQSEIQLPQLQQQTSKSATINYIEKSEEN